MPTPTIQLLYNPGEYIPYPIAPEGVPTVADIAIMEDLPPEIKALLKRNKQRVEERNQREYEEHRRKTDVRFTGEKPLQTEDHLFAGALMGGHGLLTRAGSIGLLPAVAEEIGGAVGGVGMGYLGNKTGNIIDTNLGTTWATPTFSFLGGLFGGASGVNKGYKTVVNLGGRGLLPKGGELLYKNQFRSDVLGNVLSKANMISSSNAPLRHYIRWSLNDGSAHQTNIYDMLTGKDIGQISTQTIDGGVDRVRRIQGEPEYKWKGRSLYSAEIMETPRGLISGENLEMPEATVPTWKHFDHEVIGDYGLHGTVSGQPVVRLKYAETYLPKAEPKVIEYVEQTVPVSGNTSYKFFERPSKLTWEERLGIPKGERNQPGKPRSSRAIEYDIVDGRPTKEFLDDYHAHVEALKTGGSRVDITDMFDSSWYRQRLLNQGLTEEQADQLILRLKDRVSPENLVVVDGLNSVRNFRRIENGIPIEMTPERLTLFGRHATGPGLSGKSLISLTTKADPEEIILHEIGGHRSQPLVADFKDTYLDQTLTSLGLKHHMKIGEPADYGLNWGEVRARALTIAKQMSDAGWNPNSPEQVNVWLNKHIFTNSPKNANQGALYYDRPGFVKAITTGLKQGGKIENDR